MSHFDNSLDFGVILNLTQHPATAEQRNAGVMDFGGETLTAIKSMLTFDRIPTGFEVNLMAQGIARLAADFLRHENTGMARHRALIGGAPFLMSHLEHALIAKGIQPLYAFSQRVSVEEIMADGSTKKTSAFRHEGFIPAYGTDSGNYR